MEPWPWAELASLETACSKKDFFSGVEVWLARPHVVNRRLLGSVVLQEEAVERGREGELLSRLREDMSCALGGGGDNGSNDPMGCITAGVMAHSGGTSRQVPNMEVDPPPTEYSLRCLVRELLPRMRSLLPGREAVIVGDFSVSFYPLKSECTSDTVPIPLHSTPSGSTLPNPIPPDPIPLTFTPPVPIPLGSTSPDPIPPDPIPPGSYRLQYAPPSESTSASVSLFVATRQSSSPSEGYSANGITAPTVDWLRSVLLPKQIQRKRQTVGQHQFVVLIVQWAEENSAGGDRQRREPLVSLEGYCRLYHHLKERYGPPLIKNWPETTDPQKFVYEDIAIATYLLLLWEEERKELGVGQKQSFVDLGCGNGLLVYLLSSEGHPGKGIDLRERKIWKMYGAKASLEACAITPSDESLFPDSDWLIGNHSDELTPWIPVMAARSSFHTRYFVLPCCPHDFDCKFSRPSTLKSQYRSYLDYVRLIGENMGFVVEEDTLRIPSSKRVCQIGRKRSYPPSDEAILEQRRRDFLYERCGKRKHKDMSSQRLPSSKTGGPGDSVEANEMDFSMKESISPFGETTAVALGGMSLSVGHESGDQVKPPHDESGICTWAAGFRPRSSHEHVRNCSQVDRGVKEHIVRTLAGTLLETEDWLEVGVSGINCTKAESSEAPSPAGASAMETQRKQWNRGGRIHLAEAVKLFDASTLAHLKQEFGGLQSLLRNHHQIFQVNGGHVQLRNWTLMQHAPRRPPKPRSQKDAKLLAKTKPCWFYDNHPQGCPRSARDCPYAHGSCDLRERPDFGIFPDFNLEI